MLSINKYPVIPIQLLDHVQEYKDWELAWNERTSMFVLKFIGTNMKPFKLLTNAFFELEEEEEEEEEDLTSPAPRDIYKAYYNGVDIFNKGFYAFRFKHRHFKWKTQCFDDALSIALMNSWVLYNSNSKLIKKSLWAKEVADALIEDI